MNIQTLVDSAIEANMDAYKNEVKKSALYKRVAKSSTTKKETNDFNNYALQSLYMFNTIEETLIRLFPDFDEYISNKLVKARLDVAINN